MADDDRRDRISFRLLKSLEAAFFFTFLPLSVCSVIYTVVRQSTLIAVVFLSSMTYSLLIFKKVRSKIKFRFSLFVHAVILWILLSLFALGLGFKVAGTVMLLLIAVSVIIVGFYLKWSETTVLRTNEQSVIQENTVGYNTFRSNVQSTNNTSAESE